jgi:hypothetical protein
MVTFLINVPMNEELARVGEAALEFLERYAYGFLVALVPGPNRRLPLAVGLRLTRGWDARALQQVSKSARRNGTSPMVA